MDTTPSNKPDFSSENFKFPWAESLFPELLKSPWWIGHIPFAFELIARLQPAVLVELGTYSGSSFAAFCQAAKASGAPTHCYGVDLWEGDIHMGRFDEELYKEVSGYMESHFPGKATLIRKDFNAAVFDFADGSVDFLHIDGTHTFEAVSNDFNTWLPKLSDRSVVLFHDINVNEENCGPSSRHFGVRRFFDSAKGTYPNFEFEHCFGLGVLVTGGNVPAAVVELVELSKSAAFRGFFETKGAAVSKAFDDMKVALPQHDPYTATPMWRRASRRVHGMMRRVFG